MTLNWKGLGWKAGAENWDIAEYSPSSYKYLYAKQMNLLCIKLSCWPVVIGWTPGDVIGGLLITSKDSALNWSMFNIGSG